MSSRTIIYLLAFALAYFLTPQLSLASERPLKISLLGATNEDAPRHLTIDDLERLPTVEASVYDPYLQRTIRYKGVLLKHLVSRYASAETRRIRVKAIDEYRVDFSPDEWQKDQFILATRMDGKRFGIKESGPAKIVMQTEDPDNRYVPKWIWMINRIEFLEE